MTDRSIPNEQKVPILLGGRLTVRISGVYLMEHLGTNANNYFLY